MKGRFLLAVGLTLCVDGILLGLQDKNMSVASSDSLDQGVHLVVDDCAPGKSFGDRVQDFCGRFDEAAVSWYSCRVSGGVCRQDTEHVGEPTVVVWQIMENASPQPSSLQMQNAKYLPEQAEIRWVDDYKAAVLMQHISHDLSQAGVTELCSEFMMYRPGAFRADIFRAGVLWKYGGLYMDDKLMLAQPLHKSLNLKKSRYVLSVRDTPPEMLWNALMYASDPELPFIRCYIERQREVFNARDYCNGGNPGWIFNSLKLTGPGALYSGWQSYLDGRCGALHEVDMGSHLVHENFEFNGEGTDNTVRSDNDGQPLVFSNRDFHTHQQIEGRTIDYPTFWSARQVFCDETCDDPTGNRVTQMDMRTKGGKGRQGDWPLRYVDPCITHFGCEYPKNECS